MDPLAIASAWLQSYLTYQQIMAYQQMLLAQFQSNLTIPQGIMTPLFPTNLPLLCPTTPPASPVATEPSTDCSTWPSRPSSSYSATRASTPQLNQEKQERPAAPTPVLQLLLKKEEPKVEQSTPKNRVVNRRELVLWAFILDTLQDKSKRHLVEWTREEAGEFRFTDPEGFARLWGEQKGERSAPMRFEVMTRGLRFYYKKGIVEKVKQQKYVFRFLKVDELKKKMKKH